MSRSLKNKVVGLDHSRPKFPLERYRIDLNRAEELTAFSIDFADELEAWISGLPPYKSFSVDRLFDWRGVDQVSHYDPSRKRIKIVMNRVWALRDLELRGTLFLSFFSEYAAFKSHSIIGSYRAWTPELYLRGLVAHEMAHAMQYFPAWTTRPKPHGREFRRCYQLLRMRFVNPYL